MQLHEPFAVIDTFATGIAKIEKLRGGNLRVVFYVEGSLGDGTTGNVVVAKIIIPSDDAVPLLCH